MENQFSYLKFNHRSRDTILVVNSKVAKTAAGHRRFYSDG